MPYEFLTVGPRLPAHGWILRAFGDSESENVPLIQPNFNGGTDDFPGMAQSMTTRNGLSVHTNRGNDPDDFPVIPVV